MLQSTEREEGRKGFLDFRLFFSHKDTLDKKVDKKEGGGGGPGARVRKRGRAGGRDALCQHHCRHCSPSLPRQSGGPMGKLLLFGDVRVSWLLELAPVLAVISVMAVTRAAAAVLR